jgi:hypothetical protein
MSTELIPGQEPYIGPGIRGYTMEHEGALYVPLIFSDTPGKGNLSRYLDALPKNRTIRFPNVLNSIFAGALHRRGFRLIEEWCEEFSEMIEVWERTADIVSLTAAGERAKARST